MSPPPWVSDLPREYKNGKGKVTKEAGILEKTNSGKKFWKTFQLIEMKDGNKFIRTGYYTETGGYQNKPLMLPPEQFEDLTEFAEEKIW